MRVLHLFADGYGPSIACDSNHDGRAEIHADRFVSPNTIDYDILQRSGINEWTLVHREPTDIAIDGGGDGDQDGRFDILRTGPVNGVEIVESLDSTSFPSVLVYTDPGTGSFQTPAKFTNDLDGDGRREIIWTRVNGSYLEVVVDENTGDNTYQEVAHLPFAPANRYPGEITSGNLDGDPWPDILTTDSNGNVYVFENRGDNAYDLVWQYDLAVQPRGVVILGDADGDGRLEFATETVAPPSAAFWVFECVGDDQYVVVSSMPLPIGGNETIRAADIDGDGRNDVVIGVRAEVQLWRAIANDSWEMFYDAPAGGRGRNETLAADLNNNGFAEVLYTNPYPALDHSYLIEWPWRVDASQNDLDHPADVIFTLRDRAALRRIAIHAGTRNITAQIRDWLRQGNPNVSVAVQGDETVLRLNVLGLGAVSGRQIPMRIAARDPNTGEAFDDRFVYVTP